MLQLRVKELESLVQELESRIREQDDLLNEYVSKSINYANSVNKTLQLHTDMINSLTTLSAKGSPPKKTNINLFVLLSIIVIAGGLFIGQI